jgi:hypothetical protein
MFVFCFYSDPGTFEFDVSILYSTRDEHWVTEELIPLLETENSFKCFVHFRDYNAGAVLHENMADAIYKCRKILAVVSRNFLESNYCKEELHMALGRVQSRGDYSLIVVNLDGISKDLLPHALKLRTFINLTSTQEKRTWRNRLVRQISVEEGNRRPNNEGNQVQTERLVRVTRDERQIISHINDLSDSSIESIL